MKLFIKYCTQHEVFLQLNNFVDSGVKAQKLNCDKKLGNKNYLEEVLATLIKNKNYFY